MKQDKLESAVNSRFLMADSTLSARPLKAAGVEGFTMVRLACGSLTIESPAMKPFYGRLKLFRMGVFLFLWGVGLGSLELQAQERVREIWDIAYSPESGAKRRLNLFLPEGTTRFPVVMWIHGGGWSTGDRWQYTLIGRRFAEVGIGCAVISYRLSPWAKHPDHIQDCAAAFAWLYANMATYGGDPNRMFVCGHSAGGHLTALLTLDRKYLDEQRVPPDAIKGAIPIGAVLAVPPPGKGPLITRGMFARAFGCDPKVRQDASPLNHLSGCRVPIRVITETVDPGILRPIMHQFRSAAEREGVESITFSDAPGNHLSVVLNMMRRGDPVLTEVVEFIRERCRDLDRAKK